MLESSILTTFYNSALSNSNATLWTANATYGNVVKKLLATNADSVSHTVTLTLVRKGGSPTDSYAVPICAALPIPGGSTANLMANEQLQSALDELQLEAGDYLYGLASAGSEVTLLVLGS